MVLVMNLKWSMTIGHVNDVSWRCSCNHRTFWTFTRHREHLTDPNEGLTDTQIRLGKQVSQVKVSYFVRKQFFVLDKIWKESNWRCYRQRRRRTNEWSWVTIIRTKSFSGKNGGNFYVCSFYQVFYSFSARFLCGRSTFAKLENKEIQSVLEEGFLFLTERWNIWESFTGKEHLHLLVGLSSGGPSDPCMWLRGTNLRRTS